MVADGTALGDLGVAPLLGTAGAGVEAVVAGVSFDDIRDNQEKGPLNFFDGGAVPGGRLSFAGCEAPASQDMEGSLENSFCGLFSWYADCPAADLDAATEERDVSDALSGAVSSVFTPSAVAAVICRLCGRVSVLGEPEPGLDELPCSITSAGITDRLVTSSPLFTASERKGWESWLLGSGVNGG